MGRGTVSSGGDRMTGPVTGACNPTDLETWARGLRGTGPAPGRTEPEPGPGSQPASL